MIFDAVARHRKGILSMSTFRDAIGGDGPEHKAAVTTGEVYRCLNISNGFPKLKEAEEFLVLEAVKAAKGNQGAAAALLGISRQALNQRIAKKRSETGA